MITMNRITVFRRHLICKKIYDDPVILSGRAPLAWTSFSSPQRGITRTAFLAWRCEAAPPHRPSLLMCATWRSTRFFPLRFASRSSERAKDASIPVSWKSVGATLVIAGIFWAGMAYTKKEKESEKFRERQKQIGKAKIGGEWELTDMNGNPRTSKEFLGTWLLIYFGFTHCPDICPDEIEKMMKTLTLLEKRMVNVKFETLFITVDPARDDVAAVKRYCKDFSPRLLGLTGTPEQVNKAAKAFRVYYSAAAPDDENDYIVDHTIIIYLIDSEGKFVDYYGQAKTAEQMAEHIESHVHRYKYLNL